MYVELAKIKKHLNIDSGYTDDDELLTNYESVAESVIERHIDYKLNTLAASNGGELPSPLKQAILFYMGNLYANRESDVFSTATELPMSYNYLLDLYKNYGQSGNTTVF